MHVGKYHLIQKLDQAGKLLSERSDKDGNGKFEFEADYSKPNMARLQYDDNQDGHFERTETRWISKEKTDVLIEIFSKNGQRLNRRFVVARPHSAPSIDCTPQPSDYAFLKSNRALGALLDEARIVSRDESWAMTSFGVKVHNSCLQVDIDFLNILQSSWADGLACMNRLGGRGSQEQIAKAAALLANQDNPPKVHCLNTENGLAGTATIPGESAHPEIGVNITTVPVSRKNLRSTLFHELMHNCGQIHGADVEYAYTCPKCCFESSQASCEICKGDFSSVSDPEYVSRMRRMHSASPDPGTESFLRSSLFTTDLPVEERLLNFLISEQKDASRSPLYGALYRKLKHRLPELSAEGIELPRPELVRNRGSSSELETTQAEIAVQALEALARLDGSEFGRIQERLREENSPLLSSIEKVHSDFMSFVDRASQRAQSQ